jgi:hypothetical protein
VRAAIVLVLVLVSGVAVAGARVSEMVNAALSYAALTMGSSSRSSDLM